MIFPGFFYCSDTVGLLTIWMIDVMELAKIRIRWIQILCLKSVGLGFVLRSQPSRFVQANGWNAA